MPRPDQNNDIASVRRQATEGGLIFEAYLPPALAEWVIGLVEHEVFHSPAEVSLLRKPWNASGKRWKSQEQSQPCGTNLLIAPSFPKTDQPPSP
jgi:hypothetical protein